MAVNGKIFQQAADRDLRRRVIRRHKENRVVYLLPEPSSPLMLARTYKEEVARPLVKKLKSIIKSLFVQYHKVRDNLIRVTGERDKLLQENNRLSDENGSLTRENAILKEQNKGFRRLQKYFGPQKLEEMLNQAKAPRQLEHQEKQANIA